jgi:hypothetical protein
VVQNYCLGELTIGLSLINGRRGPLKILCTSLCTEPVKLLLKYHKDKPFFFLNHNIHIFTLTLNIYILFECDYSNIYLLKINVKTGLDGEKR